MTYLKRPRGVGPAIGPRQRTLDRIADLRLAADWRWRRHRGSFRPISGVDRYVPKVWP